LYLLAACVRYYIPLEVEEQKLFNRIVKGLSNERIQAMNKTIFEEAYEEGIEKGIEKGRELQRLASLVEMAEAMLDKKFGPLPEGTIQKLRAMNKTELQNFMLELISADSLAALGLSS